VPRAESLDPAHPLLVQRALEPGKAWKEMLHRYLAASLGLGILLLAGLSLRRRGLRRCGLPLTLVALVIFQGLLGMWTVTLLVKPAIVTLHLLGGLGTTALLWWYVLREGASGPRRPQNPGLRAWTWLALALLVAQIILGGWTSTNYAALACTEFPACFGGHYFPPLDFGEAFVLWRGLGVDYEYGVLSAEARAAIHVSHRLGALAVLLVIGGLAAALLRDPATRRMGGVMAGLLVLQLGLGVNNIVSGLPLANAVAHNGGAALLLLALLRVMHESRWN
jgi:cytochrome c oxidase assembly protein subunit 15